VKETKIYSAVPALEKLFIKPAATIDDVDIVRIQQVKKNVLAAMINHNVSYNESL